MELPVKTKVGPNFQVVHGYAMVVNEDAVIGSEVIIRQGVTVGNRGDQGGSPVIHDGVSLGSGSCILGPIVIGSNARIGSNAVVLADVPPGATAVGNPARVILPS